MKLPPQVFKISLTIRRVTSGVGGDAGFCEDVFEVAGGVFGRSIMSARSWKMASSETKKIRRLS